jgi:hypothetical protein
MKTSIQLAILILFLVAPNLYAYFDPSIGRWANRDPVIEYAAKNFISKLEPKHTLIPAWKTSTLETEYTFTGNNAADRYDLLGLCGFNTCGRDVTPGLRLTQPDVWRRFNNLSYWKQQANCEPWRGDPWGEPFELLWRGATGWDLEAITFERWKSSCGTHGCGVGVQCFQTVHISEGQSGCFSVWDVNYVSFGWMANLCSISKFKMDNEIIFWKDLKIFGDGGDPIYARAFADAGLQGWPAASYPVIPAAPIKYLQCDPCGNHLNANLESRWPHSDWNYIY